MFKYPTIVSIIQELKNDKLITGYEFPLENKIDRVRVTAKGSISMPITFERRDMRRYIHWDDHGQPYVEDDPNW